MTERTAVFSDRTGLHDEGALVFLLRSIFSDAGFVAYLAQQVAGADNRAKSHNDLVSVLANFFEQAIPATSGAQRRRLEERAEEFKRHLAATETSALAYSSQGKANPTGVFWPNPERADGGSLKDTFPVGQRHGLVSRETAIGSAGSCFAYEIARNLQRRGFNYVVTEREHDGSNGVIVDAFDPQNPYVRFSATWGLIFNTPSLRQMVERAFGETEASPMLLEEVQPDGSILYTDPYREGVAFGSPEAFEADYHGHLSAVRAAFTRAEVFIVTLGLNECWAFKHDGSVLSNTPRRGWMVTLTEPRTLSVMENVEEVERFLAVVRRYNPGFKLILSLSPIPLMSTFRGDQHVITANAHSKSVLRVAADEIVRRNDGVFYFPSYEYVMHCAPAAWEADERHVTAATVNRIMEMFDAVFVRGDDAAGSGA